MFRSERQNGFRDWGMRFLIAVGIAAIGGGAAFAGNDPLAPSDKPAIDLPANLCAQEPRDRLCDRLPNDVSDFNGSLVYTLIEKSAQDPFDVFSWQSFTALNWPVGMKDTMSEASSYRPVWQDYDTPVDLFGTDEGVACGGKSDEEDDVLVITDTLQNQGMPLIDQRGNYVVYDVRIGPEMAAYISDNRLITISGQQAFQQRGRPIDYPKGYYDDPETRIGGAVGALAIKSAWRVFSAGRPLPESAAARFFTRPGRVALNADRTADGTPRCLNVTLALVGFHIMRRTTLGNGGDWIWSTFEHVDNAPIADTARGPNNIFAAPLFPDGCPADVGVDPAVSYSFFSRDCTDCSANASPTAVTGWRWQSEEPYAGLMTPTQVTRCWRPASSTIAANAVWQEALGGTIWQHYALSTTQWKGAPPGDLFPAGEVPRYLTNTTMETYLQDKSSGSCLGCHASATDQTGAPGNFSFLLLRAKSD